MTDDTPTVVDHDAVVDAEWFGAHPGRSCYVRAHHDGWVLVMKQVTQGAISRRCCCGLGAR